MDFCASRTLSGSDFCDFAIFRMTLQYLLPLENRVVHVKTDNENPLTLTRSGGKQIQITPRNHLILRHVI